MNGKKAISAVQHNKLIEARYSLTVGEQRLIFAMISKIKQGDDDFFEYTITLTELASLLDVPLPYIYNEIDKTTERLMSRVLHIKLDNGDLMKLQWVCTAIHKKDCIVLSFAPKLKPYLLKLKSEFTITDITIVRRFQSIYSIRIYQLLRQYIKIGWRELELQELREMLGIENKQYREFSDFKKRVLSQAQREFEKPENKCDLNFYFETIKNGKRIVRLRFFIYQQTQEAKKKEKQSQPAQSPSPHPQQPAKVPPPKYWKEFREYAVKNNNVCLIQMIDLEEYDIPVLRYDYQNWLKENYLK